MTITTITLVDDAEKTITQTIDTVLRSIETKTVWKPGTRQFNADVLTQRAVLALASNATFLGIASPSNAQVSAQVKALTRQANALMRITLNDMADVSDS